MGGAVSRCFRLTKSSSSKKRYAVLVGCNYAGNERGIPTLKGCINDVGSMYDIIRERFEFRDENIIILRDDGRSGDLPTGKAIREALKSMIRLAEPGDELFFYFAGHGTKFDDKRAIVPYDCNLITNMDLRKLVRKLAQKSVTFTFVADCCRSGGMIYGLEQQIGPRERSPSSCGSLSFRSFFGSLACPQQVAQAEDDENDFVDGGIPRGIAYENLVSILQSISGLHDTEDVGALLQHKFGADASSTFKSGSRWFLLSDSSTNDWAMLLSGCQPDEKAYDDNIDGKFQGVFTYAIARVLKENPKPLANRELVGKVRRVFKDLKRNFQHPCLYCSGNNAKRKFLLQNGTTVP